MTLAQDRIEHLRVRGSSSRAHAEAVLRQLSTLDLHTPGLGPSAVLVVRQLRDPLPGQVGRHGEWRLPPRWRQALGTSLAHAAENAARPLDGVLARDCNAVVFADETELLACLALDVAVSAQHERWWWQAILANLSPAARGSVAQLLHHQLPLVPAALSLLDSWRCAPRVAAALSQQQTETLTSALSVEFGASAFKERRSSIEPWAPRAARSASIGGRTISHLADASPAPEAPPPWKGLLRSESELESSAAALFGLGVLLARSPGRAREFASATERWLESQELRREAPRERHRENPWTAATTPTAPDAGPETNEPSPPPPTSMTLAHAERLASATSPPPPSGAAGPEVTAAPARSARSEAAAATTDSTDRDATHVARQSHPKLGSQRPLVPSDPPDATEPSRGACTDAAERSARTDLAATDAGPAVASSERSASTRATAGVRGLDASPAASWRQAGSFPTRLGGVFYLVNLLDHLDLPGVFEADFRLESSLGAWGTLELIGRALLGPEGAHHDDPLWEVLSELGGRDRSERLGEGYQSAAEVRLPERWREEFAGPLPDRRSLTWLSRWVASADLIRWAETVLPFLEARLALSMGLAEPAPAREGWCVPARVHLAPLHIDVVMSLEDISIAMRRSGLDRSPAWVASFGKIILIHFEGP